MDEIQRAPLAVISWHQDVLECTSVHPNAKGLLEDLARTLLHADVSGVSPDDRIILMRAFQTRARDVGLEHLIHLVQQCLFPDDDDTPVFLGLIFDMEKASVIETTPGGPHRVH